jgi:hypothetical protein
VHVAIIQHDLAQAFNITLQIVMLLHVSPCLCRGLIAIAGSVNPMRAGKGGFPAGAGQHLHNVLQQLE